MTRALCILFTGHYSGPESPLARRSGYPICVGNVNYLLPSRLLPLVPIIQVWIRCVLRVNENRISHCVIAALSPSGKRSIVKLAQRMTRGFCSGICSTVDEWELVQDADNTKLMTRKSSGNSGAPPGVILSASTTVWMPVSPQHLLDFLQDEKTRSHWDVLSQDGPMQPMLRFSKGRELDNNISLLRASVSLP